MGKLYQPPYTITSKIINLIAKISESVGRLSVITNNENALKLRRINRIKTIQGSLAIEGNTLDESHITDIINGKRVLAPQKEIQEVRNAIEVYDHFGQWQPDKEQHLLDAHHILMKGLIDEIGSYRSGGVGVLSGQDVIHVAPPANQVPRLMKDLFSWLNTTDDHPMIVSCVFHYEFEFIHPFSDGNGRMGRLWQSLILSKWHELLAYIPVESLVYKYQKAYYQAIHDSTAQSDSSAFIEFILSMLLEAILELSPQEDPQVTPQVKSLIQALSNNEMRRDALQQRLNLKDRKSFRERYLQPAIEAKLVEMTIPDKPNSKLQKYRLTSQGLYILNNLEAKGADDE
ncbi:Fic family protein [Fangia hongkongensis]|nr:Fic family protein [Fangia hongkongensis]MBK2124991.1 Fic family protein [Fangia hongkongensis]